MTENADTATAEGRNRPSRTSDVVAAVLGVAAAGVLLAAPSLVDRSGPDPFYKGPLIFPLIALAITVAGALPSIVRLVSATGRGWHVEGQGVPVRAVVRFALACLYAPAIAWDGLDTATLAFMLAGLLVTNPKRPLRAVVTAVATTIVLHLALVTALDLWLPTPALSSPLAGG